MIGVLAICIETNITVLLPRNTAARVYVVVFIIDNGDVRFVSLKTTSAVGVLHPKIVNLNCLLDNR